MVAPNTQTLTAVFLYSQKDEAIKERFGDYLKLLQSRDDLLDIRFEDIESLSPFRFGKKMDKFDLFIFASSPHLFAHPNMKDPIFRKLMHYHNTRRLRVAAVCCRPWALEDTVLKDAIRFPGNGKSVDRSNEQAEDEAYRDIFNDLSRLCEKWKKEKTGVEHAWRQARAIHEVEAYEAFLKKYPHCRHAQEARNLADNLTEAELWEKANKEDGLKHFYSYLLSPSKNDERLDEAAQKITGFEEDDERFWRDTETQKGPEFFLRYKAMFPRGKHIEEANKKLGKILSKPAPLATAHVKPTEYQYLMHLAYQHLPEEEFFALDCNLMYCGQIRRYRDYVSFWNFWKQLLFTVSYIVMLGLIGLACWYGSPLLSSGSAITNTLVDILAVIAFLYSIDWIARSFHFMKKDRKELKEARQALAQMYAYLKVGFLTNDARGIWKIQTFLDRTDRKLHDIQHKGFFHYLFPEDPGRQE